MSLYEIPSGIDLSRIALRPNPDGSPPNFDDPPSLAPLTYGLVSILIVVSGASVGLRCAAALRQYTRLRFDDYLCIIAWVLTCAFGTLVCSMYTTARHVWDTPVSAFDEAWFKKSAIMAIMSGPTMWCAKASILALYIRMFGTITWLRRTCWFMILFLALVYSSTIPVYIIYHLPYGDERWDLSLAKKAHHTDILNIITASINVAADILLIVLPMPVVAQLKISNRKRIGLYAVFMTGIFATVATGFGLYYRVELRMHAMETADATWSSAMTFLIAVIELSVTIIISCVPGCVSAWRNIIKRTKFVNDMRSYVRSATGKAIPAESTKESTHRRQTTI